jgi:predicted negative regulator of RcsB-dependent stress response
MYRIAKNSKKNNFKAIFHRLPTIILCCLILIFVSRAAYNAYKEKRKSQSDFEAASLTLNRLTERQDFVQTELEKMSTEGGEIAKLREKFGVGLPGEQLAIIVEGQGGESADASDNWFQKVKNFFETLFER